PRVARAHLESVYAQDSLRSSPLLRSSVFGLPRFSVSSVAPLTMTSAQPQAPHRLPAPADRDESNARCPALRHDGWPGLRARQDGLPSDATLRAPPRGCLRGSAGARLPRHMMAATRSTRRARERSEARSIAPRAPEPDLEAASPPPRPSVSWSDGCRAPAPDCRRRAAGVPTT